MITTMLATETASAWRPTAMPSSAFSAVFHFLRRELAPFRGRAAGTARVVVACVSVLIVCMTLRIPEAYLSVWVVTRFSMEESSQTLLTAIVFLLALTIGLAIPVGLLTFAMDEPGWRFCLMAMMAGAGLFLRRTFVIGALGFVIGLIGTMIMTLPDFIPVPDLAVRASLWLWSVFALGIVAAVVANLLIAPADPEALLRQELIERMRAAEDSISRRFDGGRTDTARRLAAAGVTRLLSLLKSAEVAHASVRARHAQYASLITLSDRLVATAAALELLSTAPVRERERLERVAADCSRLRLAFEARRSVEFPAAYESGEPPPDDGSAMLPLITELEHTVRLLEQALGPQGSVGGLDSEEDRPHLFVPDAFSNPEYLRYALKGTLAVMICYTLQIAVDWPGIRTCIITCLIVALTSEGAMIQKATLRITGAVVGAALGFLAILLLVPSMESITSLAIVVAAGTAIAAWVILGGPRISYAGVQIALAFYICVIQGFEPTWFLYTIRDRLVGILLGNAVISLVFHNVWPVRASVDMWTRLGAALRQMAALATVGARSDDQTIVATEAQRLRLQASRDFAAAQQLADDAAFELFGPAPERPRVEAREQLQRMAADAQAIFLTQLAIAEQRPDVAPTELPDSLVEGVRDFDAAIGQTLSTIADGLEQRRRYNIPDLRAPLVGVTDLVRMEARSMITSAAIVAQIEARLALYRELIPRIERLGLEVAADHPA